MHRKKPQHPQGERGRQGEEMNMIQVTTIVTFVISTYWVVMKYPTPISGSERLRRD